MNQRHLLIIFRLLIILLIFVILYCFLLIRPLWKPILEITFLGLLPFILSSFIAFLLHPLVMKLEEIGIKKTYAIILIYILFFGGFGYLFYLGIPIAIKQIRELSEQSPVLFNQYREWIHSLEALTSHFPISIQKQIDDRIYALELWFNEVFTKGTKFLLKLVDFALIIAVIPFISFYIMKDIDLIKRAAWYVTPKKLRNNGIHFLLAVNKSLGGYIRGQFLVCLLIGSAAAIIFWILGIQYPIILGMMIGITNIIPYFGPFIGAVPVIAFSIMSSMKLAMIALVVIVILQFIEGNILSPYIVGKSLEIHPLFVIAALIIGGEAFGVIGMIISVPILAILKIAIVHSRDYLIQSKQM